jgi:hypothetical protein
MSGKSGNKPKRGSERVSNTKKQILMQGKNPRKFSKPVHNSLISLKLIDRAFLRSRTQSELFSKGSAEACVETCANHRTLGSSGS